MSAAPIVSAKSAASAYGVCRSPRSAITSVGTGSIVSRPGTVRRTRPPGSRPTRRPSGRTPAGALTEAQRGLELVEQRLRLDHRRDEDQPLGAEPAEPQGQVGRDGAERVRDHRLGRSESGEHRVQCLGELQPVRSPRTGRPVLGVAVGRRVEHHHPVARPQQWLDHGAELRRRVHPSHASGTRCRRPSGPKRWESRPLRAPHDPGPRPRTTRRPSGTGSSAIRGGAVNHRSRASRPAGPGRRTRRTRK